MPFHFNYSASYITLLIESFYFIPPLCLNSFRLPSFPLFHLLSSIILFLSFCLSVFLSVFGSTRLCDDWNAFFEFGPLFLNDIILVLVWLLLNLFYQQLLINIPDFIIVLNSIFLFLQ